MKKLLFSALGLLIFILFSSCQSGKPLVTQNSDNNQTYEVDYLFEHDGCKVYRFKDKGNYVYFTNCTGDVTAIKNDSTSLRIQTSIKSDIIK